MIPPPSTLTSLPEASDQKALLQQGTKVSLSRKGNWWANAPLESFSSTLKQELADTFANREAAA